MKHLGSRISILMMLIAVLLIFAACASPGVITFEQGNDGAKWQGGQETPKQDEVPAEDPTQAPTQAIPPPPTKQPTSPPEPTLKQTEFAIEMNLGETITVDLLNGSGDVEITVIETNDELVLRSSENGQEYSRIIENAYFVNAYFIRTSSEDSYVMVSYDLASDDYVTSIYPFFDTEPDYLGDVDGYVTEVEGQNFTVFSYLYAIGSWGGYRDYILTPGDFLDVDYPEYEIDRETMYRPMITTRELPVLWYQDGDYVDGTVEAGAVLYFAATDAATYMKFNMDDGRAGAILFESDEFWNHTIDGIIVDECFEEVFASD